MGIGERMLSIRKNSTEEGKWIAYISTFVDGLHARWELHRRYAPLLIKVITKALILFILLLKILLILKRF